MNIFKTIRKIVFWGLIYVLFTASAKANEAGKVDVQEIVFSHIQDAYTWHITEWGETEITIPLPVLVKGEGREWEIFLSDRLHNGKSYHGYRIATTGDYAGKIVEENQAGEEVRPRLVAD